MLAHSHGIKKSMVVVVDSLIATYYYDKDKHDVRHVEGFTTNDFYKPTEVLVKAVYTLIRDAKPDVIIVGNNEGGGRDICAYLIKMEPDLTKKIIIVWNRFREGCSYLWWYRKNRFMYLCSREKDEVSSLIKMILDQA